MRLGWRNPLHHLQPASHPPTPARHGRRHTASRIRLLSTRQHRAHVEGRPCLSSPGNVNACAAAAASRSNPQTHHGVAYHSQATKPTGTPPAPQAPNHVTRTPRAGLQDSSTQAARLGMAPPRDTLLAMQTHTTGTWPAMARGPHS